MKNVWTITDYQLLQEIKCKHSMLIVPILFITIGMISILYQYEFSVYEKGNLIQENNHYEMIVSSQEIADIKNHSTLYIQDQKYNYMVTKVNTDYINWNDEIYQTIFLEIPNYQTDAVITECYFLKSKQSILNRILDHLKGVKQ